MNSNDISRIFSDLSQTVIMNIVLILAGAVLLITIGQKALSWVANRLSGKYRLYLLASVPVLRFLTIIVTLILIVPQVIEPTVANMVALLGAAGLVLGFGLKEYVSNLIAGIVALYEMPYRPGDWIQVDNAYGEVKNIGSRAVEIVTPDDTTVIIPHLKLWDRLFFNANDGGPNLLCVADFYLDPCHDGIQVRQALYDVALTSPFLQIEEPITVIASEKPWGTHYRLKAYPVELREQFQFITDLTLRAKAVLIELGVKFIAVPAVWDKAK